ncbi:DHA2 family efflux MFS transporter permease subunit [Oenococcus oeni]
MQKDNQPVSLHVKLAILGLAGLAFCDVLIETSMNVTFPTLMQQFSISLNKVQWLTTAYLLLVAATISIAAFIEKRFIFKKIFFWAGLLFIIGVICSALAPNFLILLIGRLIQALSTGLAIPLLITEIMQQIPQKKQGSYMGIGGMVIALAPSLGPTYGGVITQDLSWRLIFWFVLPIGLIAWLIGLSFIEQKSSPSKIPFAWKQFISLILAVLSITVAVNNAGIYGWTSIKFYGFLLIAVILLIVFIKLSTNSRQALISISIFKKWEFVCPLLIYFLIQFIQLSLTFLLPNCAQLILKKGVTISGIMLLCGSLISAILQPLTGRMLDSFSVKIPLVIGAFFLITSTISFTIFQRYLSVFLIAALYVIYMIGFSFVFNNSLTYALQKLPLKLISDGNAVFNTLQQYAGSLGTSVASALLANGIGTDGKQSNYTGSRHIFILNFISCAIVVILIFSIQRKKNKYN